MEIGMKKGPTWPEPGKLPPSAMWPRRLGLSRKQCLETHGEQGETPDSAGLGTPELSRKTARYCSENPSGRRCGARKNPPFSRATGVLASGRGSDPGPHAASSWVVRVT